MTKIVTVVGATGKQGKGVIAVFLNNPAYHIRAITRNFESPAAKALAAQGVELVHADVSDLESVKKAFAGSHIIFAVTDFFEPFMASQSPQKALEAEAKQGKNMAAAAAATLDTLESYIWSTLPNSLAISGGKHTVPHFIGKSQVDAYIRTQLPDLAAKTTFLWITWYHSNYAFPIFTPFTVPGSDRYVQLGNYAPDTPVLTLGDVSRNITPFIEAIVSNDKAKGEIVVAYTEELTMSELLQIWAKTKKVKVRLVQVDGQTYRDLWPLWGEEIGVMMEFWDVAREKSWTDTEGRKVLTKKDLGIAEEKFQSLVAAYEGLEL